MIVMSTVVPLLFLSVGIRVFFLLRNKEKLCHLIHLIKNSLYCHWLDSPIFRDGSLNLLLLYVFDFLICGVVTF